MFNATHGLFADTWSAWTELFLNFTLTIIGGHYWGIAGILLSKVITTTLIGQLWKPYYLFHSGLHLKYSIYWKGVFLNFMVSIISFFGAHIILNYIDIDAKGNFLLWIQFCAIGVCIYMVINITLTMIFCKGAHDLVNRIPLLNRNKIGSK